MIRKDPAWNNGNYAPDQVPVEGMRLARKLGIDFEIEAYLENHA